MWNRHIEAKKQENKTHGKAVTIALVSVVFLITTVLVLFVINGPSESETQDRPTQKRIREVRPNIATNAVRVKTAPAVATTEPFTKGMRGKVERDENGKRWFNGAPVPDVKPGQRFRNGVSLNKPKIFKYHSENMLAAMLKMKGGFRSSAKIKHPEKMDKDFEKSLNEPIMIAPDDDSETIAIKNAVIEAKELIAKRIKNGETFHDIYFELSDNATKVATIRSELMRIKREMTKKGATDKEIADHVAAANRLLNEYNAKNISLPSSIRQRIELEKDAIPSAQGTNKE